MTAISQASRPTFEETWPKAPFAELIRLALSLTKSLVKLRTRLTGEMPSQGGPAAAH